MAFITLLMQSGGQAVVKDVAGTWMDLTDKGTISYCDYLFYLRQDIPLTPFYHSKNSGLLRSLTFADHSQSNGLGELLLKT